MTYLKSGGTANSFTDGLSMFGFNSMQLQNGYLFVTNGANQSLSSLNAELATALGGNTGSNFIFSVPAGHLSLNSGAGLFIYSFPSFTVDQRLMAPGNISIFSLTNLTINGGDPITAGSGNRIDLIDGTTFINNAGPNALSVSGGGNWYVYSNNPANDLTGGLVPAFLQYNANPGSTPAQFGNALFYSIAPSIAASFTGTIEKTYDGTSVATLLPGNFTSSGAINGDTITFSTPIVGSYASSDVGSGIGVTASGVAISSVVHGGIPGLRFMGLPALRSGTETSVSSILPH